MFANLRKGSLIHVFDRRDVPRYYTATVKDVSTPYVPQQRPGSFNSMPMQQFVNICIDGNEPLGVPINLDTVEKDGLTVSTSREGLMPAITAAKQECIAVIESFDRQKRNLEAYEQIIAELDPGFAKSKEQEAEIKRLNSELGKLHERLESMPTLDDIKNLFATTQATKTK